MAVEDALKVLKHQPVEKKTYLPGILLSRSDSDKVKDFAQQLKKWTGN
jgi:hypothetical protein